MTIPEVKAEKEGEISTESEGRNKQTNPSQ